MTKRNAHARQRRYTKLAARATALTSVVRHLGQGVTGRPPWSLGVGIVGPHPHGICQLSLKRFAPSCGARYPSKLARHRGMFLLVFRASTYSVAWDAAQLAWKWRDVFDQLGLLVHAPDVAAIATVVVNASAFAQGRQEPDPLTVARWTLRDRGHGWENSHHPRGRVSAPLGNTPTA